MVIPVAASSPTISSARDCNCSADSGYPGSSVVELGEGVEGVDAVFTGGGQVAADRAEDLGSGPGAQASADLLPEFDHADVPFGEGVVERHAQVVGETQHVGGEPSQTGQQVGRR